MAEICCEIIQNIFTEFKLEELLPYFKYSIEAFTAQGDSALQKITSIALLREFIHEFWKNYIQKNNSSSERFKICCNRFISIVLLRIDSQS